MIAGGVARRSFLVLALAVSAACTQTVTQRTAPATTPSSSSTTTEAPECRVSDLLVPSCGAWFGVSSPSSDGTYDYVRGLAEYEALVAEPPDILHFYERGGAPFPDAEHIAMANRAGRPRSILYFNWKPAPERSWRDIADGLADDAIATVAEGIRSYPHSIFLTIQHEPENDVIADTASGMTVSDYVAMYRHVVAELRSLGVDNAVYVMNFMGFERWSTMVDDLYPGDDVVDWIAYDPYGFARHNTLTDVLNDPNGEGWPGFYEWARRTAPSKPIMLGEWGFDLATNARAAEIVLEAPTVLPARFPMIKAVVYWNDLGNVIDARITGDAAYAGAFASSLAQVAAHPYFNELSPDDAP